MKNIKKITIYFFSFLTILIILPFFIFYNYPKNSNNVKIENKAEKEIKKIADELKLNKEIKEMINKIFLVKDNSFKILEILNDLKFLNKIKTKINNLKLITIHKKLMPSSFKNNLNKEISLKFLGVSDKELNKVIEDKLNFNCKLFSINDHNGTLMIQINLKFKKYSIKINKHIYEFKNYNQKTNDSFQKIKGWFKGLEKNPYLDISDNISTKNNIKDLLNNLMTNLLKTNNNILIKSDENNQKLIEDMTNLDDIIKIPIKIVDLENNKSEKFDDIKFKVNNISTYTINQILNKLKTHNEENRMYLDKKISIFNTNEDIADYLQAKYKNILERAKLKIKSIYPFVKIIREIKAKFKLVSIENHQESEEIDIYFQNVLGDQSFSKINMYHSDDNWFDAENKFSIFDKNEAIANYLQEHFSDILNKENWVIKANEPFSKIDGKISAKFKIIENSSKKESGIFTVKFVNVVGEKTFYRLTNYNSNDNRFNAENKFSIFDNNETIANHLQKHFSDILNKENWVIKANKDNAKLQKNMSISFKILNKKYEKESSTFFFYFKNVFGENSFKNLTKHSDFNNALDVKKEFNEFENNEKIALYLQTKFADILNAENWEIRAIEPNKWLSKNKWTYFKLINKNTNQESTTFIIYFKNVQ